MSKGEGSLEDLEPDGSTKSNLWSDTPFMSFTTLSRIVRGGVMLLQSQAVSHDRTVPTDWPTDCRKCRISCEKMLSVRNYMQVKEIHIKIVKQKSQNRLVLHLIDSAHIKMWQTNCIVGRQGILGISSLAVIYDEQSFWPSILFFIHVPVLKETPSRGFCKFFSGVILILQFTCRNVLSLHKLNNNQCCRVWNLCGQYESFLNDCQPFCQCQCVCLTNPNAQKSYKNQNTAHVVLRNRLTLSITTERLTLYLSKQLPWCATGDLGLACGRSLSSSTFPSFLLWGIVFFFFHTFTTTPVKVLGLNNRPKGTRKAS